MGHFLSTRSRLLVDLQGAQTEGSRHRGIGRYSEGFTEALLRMSVDHFDCGVALNKNYFEASFDIESRRIASIPNVEVLKYDYTDHNGLWHDRDGMVMRVAAEKRVSNAWSAWCPDVFVYTSIFEALVGKAVVPAPVMLGSSVLKAAIAYDLIPLVHAEVYLTDERVRKWYMRSLALLNQCDLLFAISEATRQDCIRFLGRSPETVINIQGGVDPCFTAATVEPVRLQTLKARFEIKDRLIMYTGGIDHRKNIEGLIDAYALLPMETRARTQLVIVCSATEQARAEIANRAISRGLGGDRVITTGFVANEELVDLYRSCDLFVFPSHYEGFGLPLLEAISCGAPSIAANNSSLPEILGDATALFDSRDNQSIASKMQEFLASPQRLTRSREQGLIQARKFSWSKTAEKASSAIAEMRMRRSGEKKAKPRLAFISPLHPEKTGIANYGDGLLPILRRHYDIDLFTNPEADFAHYSSLGYSVFDIPALVGLSEGYNGRLLYQIGNSEFHITMSAVLQRCPGVVLLHDAVLVGLTRVIELTGWAAPGFFLEMVDLTHGREIENAQLVDWDLNTQSLSVASWVCDAGLGVITTSNFARKLVGDVAVPSTVIRLLQGIKPRTAEQRLAARKRLDIKESTLVIVTFGFVSQTKQSEMALRAYFEAQLPDDVVFIFAGASGERDRATLANVANEQVVPRPYYITGYTSDEVYDDYLDSADIAVQLRTHSRGETSLAVLQNFARGTPVILSDVGPFAEIADDACLHLPERASVELISASLTSLAADSVLRKAIGERGASWLKANCDPESTTSEFVAFIERASTNRLAILARAQLKLESRSSRAIDHLDEFVARTVPIEQGIRRVDTTCLEFFATSGNMQTQGTRHNQFVAISKSGFVTFANCLNAESGRWIVLFHWQLLESSGGVMRFEVCRNSGTEIVVAKVVPLDSYRPEQEYVSSLVFSVEAQGVVELRSYFDGVGMAAVSKISASLIA